MSVKNGSHSYKRPPVGSQLDRTNPLTSGLVGGWLLNESGGTTAYPLVPGSGNAVFTNPSAGALPTWSASPDGPAVSFTGATSYNYLEVASNPTLAAFGTTRAPWTVSYSVYFNSLRNYNATVSLCTTGGVPAPFDCYVTSAGIWTYFTGDGGAFPSGTVSGAVAKTWYQISHSYDGTTCRFYINGVLKGSFASTQSTTAGRPLRIGGERDGGLVGLDGRIGYVLMHNRALSAAEVALLAQDPYQVVQAPATRRFQSSSGPATTLRTQAGVTRISATATRTQAGKSRISATATRTQTGAATIAGGAAYAQPVFTSAGSLSTDFTSVNGSGITVGSAGNGYLGKSIRIVPVASVEQAARKTYSTIASVHQMWIRTGAADTISSTVDTPFFSGFSDAAYGTPKIQVRLIGVGVGYTLRIVDPTNGYATTVGTTVLSKGVWHRVVFSMTSAGYQLYVDSQTSPEASYTHANATVGLAAAAYGTWYSGTASYTGTIDIDELYAANPSAAVSTAAQQAADAAGGYFQKFLAFDGAIVRPPAEGITLTVAGPDTVSEGQAYGLKLAVQNNDRSTFVLIDNWTRANLDRRNSTVGNTQNNAAPANALNLMAFHYNTSNADGKGPNTIYDANWAGDADVERAQALLWAHARWGSSSYTVDTANELAVPNFLQRALNVIGDLRTYALRTSAATGYGYLVADALQTSDPVQLAPDYNNTAAFRLFAQYDSGNATTWNNAVLGAHDILAKSAAQIFTGQSVTKSLVPDWITFTLSTGLTSATTSSYGDSDYGYNAFRTYYREYDAYSWYADAAALTALQAPKSFFVAEWGTVRTGSPLIDATYKHDGTITGAYERNFFYWAAYWCIYANDNANATAAAIKSGKLDGKYVQSPVGSYVDNGGAYAYFDQSWSVVGSMQKAGTFLNWGQLSTRTQSGVSRVTAKGTRTQAGVANVTVAGSTTTARVQTGVARIAVQTARTQAGTSRITVVTTKAQTGVSRIAGTALRTQAGVSRVTVTVPRTQAGISRITAKVTRTQNGVSNIAAAGSTTTTKVQSGITRIAGTTQKTQAGTSRITVATAKVQTGVSRILVSTARTQSGVSRVTVTVPRTQPGISRVTASKARTQTGVANITVAGTTTTTKVQTAVARVTGTTARTQAGISRITAVTSRTQAGVSRVSVQTVRTQAGVSRITAISSRTQAGVARVTASRTRTQTGVANVLAAGSVTTAKVQSGVARISGSGTRAQTGVSRVTVSAVRTQTGVARIGLVTVRTQTATARITAATARTQAGVGRIAATAARALTGIARISAATGRAQNGKANVTGTTVRTQTGVANISVAGFVTTTRTQTGKSRVTASTARTQAGRGRVSASSSKTQAGVSRIASPSTRTQTGVASIVLASPVLSGGITLVRTSDARTVLTYSGSITALR